MWDDVTTFNIRLMKYLAYILVYIAFVLATQWSDPITLADIIVGMVAALPAIAVDWFFGRPAMMRRASANAS